MPGGPIYGSDWLIDRCLLDIRRPRSDRLLPREQWFQWLTEGQTHWIQQMSATVPQVNYGNPVTMTTTDGGLTYRFGLDAEGRAIAPLGEAEIRDGPTGRVLRPVLPWLTDAGFVMEGDHIRWPDGRARPTSEFPNGLLARFVAPPGPIDDDSEPTIKPIEGRLLIAHYACEQACAPLKRDPEEFREKQSLIWNGDQERGQPGLLAALREQVYGAGKEGRATHGKWYPVDTGAGYRKFTP
jgi:hypothetical protein